MTEDMDGRSQPRARPTRAGQDTPAASASPTSHTELLLALINRLAPLSSLEEQFETLVEMTAAATGAERGSLFLNDPVSGELHSRATHGGYRRQIRILSSSGIAGHVFTSGIGEIVPDAYADPRFDSSIDGQTDFVTKSILCVPVRTMRGEVIGAIQSLNKEEGEFEEDDKALLAIGVTKDLTAQLKAGDLIREVAGVVGGGGGGRPDFAQAGGKDPGRIDEALEKFNELVGD